MRLDYNCESGLSLKVLSKHRTPLIYSYKFTVDLPMKVKLFGEIYNSLLLVLEQIFIKLFCGIFTRAGMFAFQVRFLLSVEGVKPWQ